jgi:ABC-type transport system involved in multi-copper enzyme maturation permease subunit
MRGLIIKDALTLKSTWKNLVVMFIGSMLLSYALANYTLAIITVPMALLTSGMNTFQTDEFYNTLSYTLSGPYSRVKMISARYLYTLLMSVISFFVGAIIFTIINFTLNPIIDALNVDMLRFLLMLELAGLLVDAVFYPIIYKYGCEKARFVLLSIVMLLLGVAAVVSVSFNIFDMAKLDWESIIKWMESNGVLVLSSITLVLFAISYSLSIFFFKKRDF